MNDRRADELQKMAVSDAHLIANMGGLLNEAHALLYDFMFNLTADTAERIHERALDLQKRIVALRERAATEVISMSMYASKEDYEEAMRNFKEKGFGSVANVVVGSWSLFP